MKTYVYIMCAGGYAKIGVANNPERRKATMQTGNPYKIRILVLIPFPNREEAFKYEKFLHTEFKEHRYQGEWFHMGKINKAFQKLNVLKKKTFGEVSRKKPIDGALFSTLIH